MIFQVPRHAAFERMERHLACLGAVSSRADRVTKVPTENLQVAVWKPSARA